MKISVKNDYAFRALQSLAAHYQSAQPVTVHQISRQQRVPSNYLVQILRELKSSGLVKSVRGKQGGYILARPPERLTVADVFRALEGDVVDVPFVANRFCPEELRAVWGRLRAAVEREAEAVTFAEIVAAAHRQAATFEI